MPSSSAPRRHRSLWCSSGIPDQAGARGVADSVPSLGRSMSRGPERTGLQPLMPTRPASRCCSLRVRRPLGSSPKAAQKRGLCSPGRGRLRCREAVERLGMAIVATRTSGCGHRTRAARGPSPRTAQAPELVLPDLDGNESLVVVAGPESRPRVLGALLRLPHGPARVEGTAQRDTRPGRRVRYRRPRDGRR